MRFVELRGKLCHFNKMTNKFKISDSYKTLALEFDPRGVLTVALNRPDIRNAFNEIMIAELSRVFANEVLHSEVRVVVLRGRGSVFCAGGDLNWMRKSLELSAAENLEDTRILTKMFALLNTCPKPVLGVAHGAAIGGGVGLVSICDLVIATEETKFSLSEVRLGIIPACIGPFVIAKIGASHARRFFLSAERFSAESARAVGLVHELVPDIATAEATLERILGNLLQAGPKAVAAAKQLVLDLSWPERRRECPDCLEYVAKMLADLRVTPEGQEGLRAFLEKRKPNWLHGEPT